MIPPLPSSSRGRGRAEFCTGRAPSPADCAPDPGHFWSGV